MQEAAERWPTGRDVDDGEGGPDRGERRARRSSPPPRDALARIDAARDEREAPRARIPAGADAAQVRHRRHRQHLRRRRCRPRPPRFAGADIVAVIRATAQSLLDYVPDGPTTEGYGGTFATQENFRIIRARARRGQRGVRAGTCTQTNYSSGLCMTEIAWMAAVERLDMLLNDAMYGILFRDINMRRTFVDQYFSRRIIARSGIVINTGEDNYLTTADAVEKAHTVLASQFINEAFAQRAGLRDEQMGLGHAFEIDPWLEDSFLLEIAQAQLVRQIFDRAPDQVDAAHQAQDGRHLPAATCTTRCSTWSASPPSSRSSCSACSARPSTRRCSWIAICRSRAPRYIFSAARHLGDEIQWKPGRHRRARAREVLDEAHAAARRGASARRSGTPSRAAPSPT